MRRYPVAVAVAVAALAGCGTSAHTTLLSVDGRVGPLRVGSASAHDVAARFGRPDADIRTRARAGHAYRVLAYDCSESRGRGSWPVGDRFCRTVFFFDLRPPVLGDVYTTSPRFVEDHGIRPGTPARAAARRLHRHVPTTGCETSIYLYGHGTVLTVAFDDRGVYALVLHSTHRDVGAFDCI
jgi:hypothetical protein